MQNLYSSDIASDSAPAGTYRIGGVSRLAGVPVTTLRVWESRHAAFSPAKSSGRHRLYSEVDVMRARLLRQLSAAGHSVGGIARLPLPELQRLLNGSRAAPAADPAVPSAQVSLALVGEALAARLDAPGWRQRHEGRPPEVRQVFASLDALVEAGAAGPAMQADILLARLNAIQAGTAEQLMRAIAQLHVNHAIVLYNFAAEPVLEAMRAAGLILRREPVSDAELAGLIASVTVVDTGGAPAFGPGATVPPRRYSDALLVKVAAAPTQVACECPRHIAEIIGQLASFEDYSRQCLDSNPGDAGIHAYLRSISGSARALFEHALQKVMEHDGIQLEPDLPRP